MKLNPQYVNGYKAPDYLTKIERDILKNKKLRSIIVISGRHRKRTSR